MVMKKKIAARVVRAIDKDSEKKNKEVKTKTKKEEEDKYGDDTSLFSKNFK